MFQEYLFVMFGISQQFDPCIFLILDVINTLQYHVCYNTFLLQVLVAAYKYAAVF